MSATTQLGRAQSSEDLVELPYQLPHGWCWSTVGDLAILENGDRGKNYPSKDALVSNGVPFLNAGHIENGRIDMSKLNFITQDRFELLSGGKFTNGDIVFCLRGSLGKCAIVSGIGEGAIASSLVIVRPTLVSAKFMYAYLSSNLAREMIEQYNNGTAQPNLSSADLRKFRVPVPPLLEQKRIADKLDDLLARVDACRDRLDRVPAILKRFRQAVLLAAFRGELTEDWRASQPSPPPTSELLEQVRLSRRNQWEESLRLQGKTFAKRPYEEPALCSSTAEARDGWLVLPLDFITREAKIGLVRSATDQSSSGPYPYIRMQHYDAIGRWNRVDMTYIDATVVEAATYELKENDVLFNTRNSYELVGKVARWPAGMPGHLYNNNLMRLRFFEFADPAFVAYQMASPEFLDRIAPSKSATTSVCAIYGRDLFIQPIYLPSIQEQREIVNRIENLLKPLENLELVVENAVSRTKCLEKSILGKAFRGELVPQDPKDESASMLLDRIRAAQAEQPKKRGRPQHEAATT